MNDLILLSKKLKEYTSHLQDARPFLCEGSPFECDIFLVGINPATSTDFWKHWSVESGCDKKQWIEEYLANHGGKLKPTRKRIEIFFEAVTPLKVLETNIFPSPSSRESELDDGLRDTQLFDYLVNAIKPKLILAHGASAINHLSQKYNMDLKKGEFIKMTNSDLEIRVENHFSYQWSYQAIKELALEVKNHY